MFFLDPHRFGLSRGLVRSQLNFSPLEVLSMSHTKLQKYHLEVVQAAVGWVLREMSNAYSSEIIKYLESHAGSISTPAFSRAIERLSTKERARLRDMRKRYPVEK